MNKNCYDVLKVPISSTTSQLKISYYKLSLLYHPDLMKSSVVKDKTAADRFIELSIAYETLKDPVLRLQHDIKWGIAKTTNKIKHRSYFSQENNNQHCKNQHQRYSYHRDIHFNSNMYDDVFINQRHDGVYNRQKAVENTEMLNQKNYSNQLNKTIALLGIFFGCIYHNLTID